MFSVKQWPIQCVETNTRSPKHLNKHFTKQHKLLVSWLAMVTEALQSRVGDGSKGSDYPAVCDKQRVWCWLKQQFSTQEQAPGCLLSWEADLRLVWSFLCTGLRGGRCRLAVGCPGDGRQDILHIGAFATQSSSINYVAKALRYMICPKKNRG